MANSPSSSSPHKHVDTPSLTRSATRNLANHFYPAIPPRRSSWQHGLRTSRSGNLLGIGVDFRSRIGSNEKSSENGTASSTSGTRSSTTSQVSSNKSSSPKSEISETVENELVERFKRIDLSSPSDAPFPVPPSKVVSGPSTPNIEASKATEALPFPLSPKPLISSRLLTTPKRRAISAGGTPESSPNLSDRFIPSRAAEDGLVRAYQVNKKPEDLSTDERISRTDGANPDPFTARRITPIRTRGLNERGQASGSPPPPRSRHPSGLQARVVSPGGIWNVGGSAAIQQRPVTGVSNGRGGLLGSGTNAPMFSSTFFNTETPHESQERFEGRLAFALDIDRTSRVLDLSHSRKRVPSTPEASPQRRNTIWKDGSWVTIKPDKGTVELGLPSMLNGFV